MFRKEYQGGTHVEVFSAQGRDPVARWKLSGTIRKEYDRQVKGYVYILEGGSSTTRMQLPRNERTLLALQQRYCVFQLLVPDEARFAIELSVLDGGGSRRRVQLSSSLREISTSPLNARAPLAGMVTGQWVNLCVDMGSLVSGLFKGQSFKSLEAISVGGSCMLRRIFTLRGAPPDTVSPSEGTEGAERVEGIPRAYQMPGASVAVETQVLTYASLSRPDRPLPEERTAGSSGTLTGTRTGGESRPTHIAFGKKVAIPEHVLNSRQSTRATSGGSSSAQGRTAHAHQPPASPLISHNTPLQEEEVGLDGRGLQPRPPHQPADPSILRIQRKRVRMLSVQERGRGRASQEGGASQDHVPGSAVGNGSVGTTSNGRSSRGHGEGAPLLGGGSEVSSGQERVALSSAHSSVETLTARSLEVTGSAVVGPSPGSTGVARMREPPSSGVAGSDSGYRTGGSHSDVGREPEQLSSDEQLAVGVLQTLESHRGLTGDAGLLSRVTPAAPRPAEAGLHLDDSLLSGSQPDDSLLSGSQGDTSLASEGVASVEEGRGGEGVEEMYSYRSPPKSANTRQPNHGSSTLLHVAAPTRGAGLDEDFLSPAEEDREQVPPYEEEGGRVPDTDADQRTQTRLSDDYDWRQYASTDGEEQLDMSLRTRLAAHAHSPSTLLPAGTTDPGHSNSSEMESTLSGSMTLSGWTEQLRDAARNPLLDSLDTRGMGGTLSPTVGTLAEQLGPGAAEGWQEGAEDELELMYDPQLNCFYDPHTCKYYELAQ